jgi:formylmethanofuran:tetrahydromethanopterin formyltransferase
MEPRPGSRESPCLLHSMHIGPTQILDTYAEAFGARYTRLVITAAGNYGGKLGKYHARLHELFS